MINKLNRYKGPYYALSYFFALYPKQFHYVQLILNYKNYILYTNNETLLLQTYTG